MRWAYIPRRLGINKTRKEFDMAGNKSWAIMRDIKASKPDKD